MSTLDDIVTLKEGQGENVNYQDFVNGVVADVGLLFVF